MTFNADDFRFWMHATYQGYEHKTREDTVCIHIKDYCDCDDMLIELYEDETCTIWKKKENKK